MTSHITCHISANHLSQLGSSTSSPASPTSTDDEADTLPYPTPLLRSAFLDPNFSPQTYLSTLRNRHQTLEDLRAELRTRSQLLNKELLDLVNDHYQDFLGLGSSLKGGDERVEEVRLGLMGFRGEVEGLKRVVDNRRREVEGLLGERKEVRRNIAVGRALLDVDARLELLEGRLMIQSTKPTVSGQEDVSGDESEEYSEDEERLDEEDEAFVPLRRLQRNAQQYMCIRQLAERIGPEHPFLVAQQPRLMRVRNTLLLDLSTALKQVRGAGDLGRNSVLWIVGIYREMDEAKEAVRVLKGLS